MIWTADMLAAKAAGETRADDLARTVDAPPHGRPQVATAPPVSGIPPLLRVGQPTARRTDPQPSRDAAASIGPRARADAMLLLAAHVRAGSAGLIGRDYEAATGRDYARIGPRRPWLVEKGWVEPVLDEHGKPVRREAQGVYRITDAGRMAAAREVAA